VVHKALVGEFFGEMNHTLVQDALEALDGDCKNTEMVFRSVIHAMGTPVEIQRHFGQAPFLQTTRAERVNRSRSTLTEAARRKLHQEAQTMSDDEKVEMVNMLPAIPIVGHFPDYMSQAYLLAMSQYRAEQLAVGQKVCTPDQMFTHKEWSKRETFQQEVGCSVFYFPEMDPGSTYYDSGFFTVEQTAAYHIDGQLFGLRHAYREADSIPGRLARQLIAAAGMAAGFVFSRVTDSVLSWLGFGKKEEDHTEEVKRVNSNSDHLGEMANHLGRVEQVNQILVSEETKLKKNSQKIMVYLKLESSTRAFLDHTNRLMAGLEDLFHGHLSPTLVNTEKLYEGLKELEFDASKKQDMLLVKDYASVWNEKTSYFLTEGKDLLVVLHLPIGSMNSLYETYTYIPTPLTMSAPDAVNPFHFQVNPRETVVAHNLMTDGRLVMTVEEFNSCPQIADGTRYCPKWGYTYKNTRTSCLMSLYESEPDKLVDYCPITAFPEEPFVAQVALHRYYTYSPKNSGGRILCKHQYTGSGVVNLKGLQMVTVREDCRLETDDFILEASIDFGKREKGYQTTDMVFDVVNYTEPLEWARDQGRLPGLGVSTAPTISEISRDWHLEKLAITRHWTFLQWVGVACGGTALFLFLLWLVKCLWDVGKRRTFGERMAAITTDYGDAMQRIRHMERYFTGRQPRARPGGQEEEGIQMGLLGAPASAPPRPDSLPVSSEQA
jgi:hypothetical protein